MPVPGSIPVLSDHAYQSMNFQALNPIHGIKEIDLNVGSWNLQDKCKSKSNGRAYANNPYNVDESDDAYYDRKRKQIEKIANKIEQGEDIIFLQECDFLLFPDSHPLKLAFKTMLQSHDCDFVLTTIPTDGLSQQPLATIYNKKKLSLDNSNSKGVFPTKPAKPPNARPQQYRGFETVFTLKDHPSTKVVATNVHLVYGEEYKSEIEQYQKQKEKEGVLCVIGGDTNNVQNLNLNTALGDWNIPTNFHREGESLTTIHEVLIDGKPAIKAYDRFFANPPRDCYIKATTSALSERVDIKNGEAQFRCLEENERHESISLVGERWRRGVDIINELSERYNALPRHDQAQQKTLILFEMMEVSKIKRVNVREGLSKINQDYESIVIRQNIAQAQIVSAMEQTIDDYRTRVGKDDKYTQLDKARTRYIKDPSSANLKAFLVEAGTGRRFIAKHGDTTSIRKFNESIKENPDANALVQLALKNKEPQSFESELKSCVETSMQYKKRIAALCLNSTGPQQNKGNEVSNNASVRPRM